MRTDIPFGIGLVMVIAGAVMLILAAFDVATSPDFNIAWLGAAVAFIGVKIPYEQAASPEDTQEFQAPQPTDAVRAEGVHRLLPRRAGLADGGDGFHLDVPGGDGER